MQQKTHTWRWWALSLSLPLGLIALRMVCTHSLTYIFYYWNLFLAAIPVLATAFLNTDKPLYTGKNLLCLMIWFLFLPNAPYLITDLIHFEQRPPVPVYLDEVIVYSAAWNGLLMAYVSMMRVERLLLNRFNRITVNISLVAVFLSCGLGISMGRYQRWNSWDIVAHPVSLGMDLGTRILFPFQHRQTWAVSLLFGVVLTIGYFLLKQLPRLTGAASPRSQTLKRNTA
jgi:uncharacterized membrane protein